MVHFVHNLCAAYRRRQMARVLLLTLVSGALLLPSGCVRRRLHVRSNPSGALVYVDNQQIGTTPCSVDFTYYGTREIRLVKPGYETLTVNQPLPAPWYQVPPLDFISENLIPTTIRDNRTICWEMSPQVIVPPEQLIERGEQLRRETQQPLVTPAAATGPVVVPGPPATMMPAAPGSFGAPPGSYPPTIVPAPLLPPAPTIVAPPSTPLPFGAPPQQSPPIVSPPLR